MNTNTTIDFRNPTVVRNAGKGDYTAERNELFRNVFSDEIAEGIRALQIHQDDGENL